MLRVIGRLGVGLDNIDVAAAKRRHIEVVAALGANAIAVAEFVLAYCFSQSRKLVAADQDVRQGHWNRTLGGFELYGKTLGIIGLGDIGQRLALRARALGLSVLASDPIRLPTHWTVMEGQVQLVELDRLLSESDFVSLHVPLAPQTRHLIGRNALHQMKSSAYLINTARGGIVDEAALLKAIRSDTIQGALLDVREVEPALANDPLLSEPRIMLTPHISGLTQEAGVRTALLVADDVLRVLANQAPRASVVR
jgi:D-3-phosphoglycerate dehydrogenase/(S)-sulfolactate dehydrogenase